MHFGLDASSNNTHPVDWTEVHAFLRALGGGVRPFAIIKATQGTGYVNPDFGADVAGARSAGMAVGAYLMDQGNNSVTGEESLFRRVAGNLPQADDFELPMGSSDYAQHCATLVSQDPAALSYLNQSEESTFPEGAGIWEANYNGQPGKVAHANVLIHQYSSNATIPGVAGTWDLNAWVGSEAAFDSFFGLTPVPTAPVPTPIVVVPPSEEEPVFYVRANAAGGGALHHFDTGAVFVLSGGRRVFVHTSGQEAWYTARLGHGPVDATPELIDCWPPA